MRPLGKSILHSVCRPANIDVEDEPAVVVVVVVVVVGEVF